jgi:UDP-N-acetylglucosamine 2-epimerase (non-hydrolysing)
MAPLIKEIEKNSIFQSIVCVTAQHRELLDQVLRVFNIHPDFDLNVMENKQSLFDITTKGIIGMQNVILQSKPDLILVHGDTTTTFISSLAAFYYKVPVGHVEAGLRTWDKFSPYPEEINRQLTSILADIHFAPTKSAAEHLLRENKDKNHIYITGNTAIDAIKTTLQPNFVHELLQTVGNGKILLVTVHRRENLGEPIKEIFRALRKIVDLFKDVYIVYPVHLNPVIQELAKEILGNHSRILLIEPLDVISFHNLGARSYLILTDSGGIQEEGPSLGIPVLVLRNVTERPEGVKAGALKLIGTKEKNIVTHVKKMIIEEEEYLKMKNVVNPYGDGKASERIVAGILHYFGILSDKPKDFSI